MSYVTLKSQNSRHDLVHDIYTHDITGRCRKKGHGCIRVKTLKVAKLKAK